MTEKIGEMYLELDARTKKLEKKLNQAKRKSKQKGAEAGKAFSGGFASSIKTAGILIGFTMLLQVVKKLVEAAKTQIIVEKQVETVVKRTGQAAGFSAKQIGRMASELQKLTGIGDEKI